MLYIAMVCLSILFAIYSKTISFKNLFIDKIFISMMSASGIFSISIDLQPRATTHKSLPNVIEVDRLGYANTAHADFD